jgi:hypothetical protein
MGFPDFFAQVPVLAVHDPLAEALGASEGGIMTYRYEHAVLLAGHSCPTVASAWLMARRGLAGLYPEGLPERGAIGVELREHLSVGTAGVVGSVLGLVTGAAGEGGFKGLGGHHVRRGLLAYGIDLAGEVRLRRLDTGLSVLLDYHPDRVPPPSGMAALMARVVGGVADAGERATYARLWQDRVRCILLEHMDDPDLVVSRQAG